MPEYQEIINDIEKAKRLIERGNAMLNVAVIKLNVLESEARYQEDQMGEELEGTLRSKINEIDKLSGGELKSSWKK